MDLESSLELVQRAQAGDASALDRLIARYRPRLQRWASGRLPRSARSFSDTEDLVQDALIGTVRNLEAFDQRGEWAFQAYLRRAVINRVRDELRRYSASPVGGELPEQHAASDPSPLEQAMGRQTFERYEQALTTLSGIEQEAVVARIELGCSYQEIADLVDKPTPDAARMVVARALQKLAALMAPT